MSIPEQFKGYLKVPEEDITEIQMEELECLVTNSCIGSFTHNKMATIIELFDHRIFYESIYSANGPYKLYVFSLGIKLSNRLFNGTVKNDYQRFLEKHFPKMAKIFSFKDPDMINPDDPYFWTLFRRMLHDQIDIIYDLIDSEIDKATFKMVYEYVYAGLEQN